MTLINKFRDVARSDSRRFAKGTVCEVVTDQKALNFINQYSLGPPGINLIYPEETPWLDPKIGKFYAVPTSSLDEYKEELDLFYSQTSNLANLTKENLMRVNSRAMPLLDFFRQKLFLCTLSKGNIIDGNYPDPNIYNVVIETIDLNQSLSCIFVEKGGRYK